MPRSLNAPTATNELPNFTNREKEKDVLRRLLDVPAGTPLLPVVMFYGVGGAGKSWLLQKLRSELPANLPSARLDFDPNFGGVPYHTDSTGALAELRRQLGEKNYDFPIEKVRNAPGMAPTVVNTIEAKHIAFPRFDLAYAFLRFKEHGKDEPRFRGSGIVGGAFELITEAAEAFADFPGVNLATWLSKKIGKPVWNQVKESALVEYLKQRVGEEDFLALQKMSPQEIYPVLLDRFLQDLVDGAPPGDGKACRAVILLDTVEALRAGLADTQASRREQWLRDLHRTDSPILLILAGRDQLRWGDADPDYRDRRCLEQHLVGGLSESDARLYLNKCGIDDVPLQDAVLRTSVDTETVTDSRDPGYHLFSLGLCTDAILAEKEQGHPIDPASFDLSPGDIASLARRFLHSLGSDHHVVWVRQLALTPRFDETAARAAFSTTRDVQQDAAWQHLRGFSFLRGTDRPGWHTLHARMRAALNETAEADWKANSHREWQERWQHRSQQETDDFAGLAWFHLHCQDRQEARIQWTEFAEALRNGRRMAEHLAILSWWDPVDLETPDQQSADALNSLGIELARASLGNRTQNLRDAIACYEAALRVYTEKDFPTDWARTQNNLGLAYGDLPTGDRGVNLAQAIAFYEAALRVYTEKDFPTDWAMTQNNLGNAYQDLPTGDRGVNLAQAIACYEAALRVYTEKDFPTAWAITQNNLGNAYQYLPTADRGVNLAQAIACYEAALRVYTEKDFPTDWAMTQNNLGPAYGNLPTGDRGVNLAQAIACFEAALRVYTEKDFPTAWAMTQNNLGNAYGNLPTEDRGVNLAKAIACYEAALRVYTEKDFPTDWAMTQNNLGNAYGDLPTGDRGVNLAKAIACYEAALRVYTEKDFPTAWATTQNNLGNAYLNLPTGDRGVNLAQAIACYEAALRVRTAKDFPTDWAMTNMNRGISLEILGDVANDPNAYRAAIQCWDDAARGYETSGLAGKAELARQWADELRTKIAPPGNEPEQGSS